MTLSEMNFVLPDLAPASAEIFLLAMACAILIIDVFSKDAKRTVTFVLTQLTLAGCFFITLSTSTAEITYTFSNMFVDDLMADVGFRPQTPIAEGIRKFVAWYRDYYGV